MKPEEYIHRKDGERPTSRAIFKRGGSCWTYITLYSYYGMMGSPHDAKSPEKGWWRCEETNIQLENPLADRTFEAWQEAGVDCTMLAPGDPGELMGAWVYGW